MICILKAILVLHLQKKHSSCFYTLLIICVLVHERFNLIQLFAQRPQSSLLRQLIVDLEVSTTPIHSLTFYLIEFFQLPLVSIDCWQAPRFDTGGLFSQDPAISYVRSEKSLNDDQRRSIQKVTNFPLLLLYDVLFFLVSLTNVF